MANIAETVSLYRRVSGQLTRREAELRAQLQSMAAAALHSRAEAAEVIDFKDLAAEEARTAVDDAVIARSTEELEQVQAALRRLHDGSYGLCIDCGATIDEWRLAVMPATRFCTECQAVHERATASPS